MGGDHQGGALLGSVHDSIKTGREPWLFLAGRNRFTCPLSALFGNIGELLKTAQYSRNYCAIVLYDRAATSIG
jgi:hypothetical protein